MWFQRKHYLIFFLNPTWLPNHATYQLEFNKLMWSFPLIWPAVLEKKMFEGFRVNSSFKLKKKIQNKMAAEPSHRWRQFYFSIVNCCADDAQEISDFSYAAFYLTNFHRDNASLMTSRKISRLPHWEFITMYEAKDFSIAPFQRYRGPKFIGFFQDGARTTWPMTSQL